MNKNVFEILYRLVLLIVLVFEFSSYSYGAGLGSKATYSDNINLNSTPFFPSFLERKSCNELEDFYKNVYKRAIDMQRYSSKKRVNVLTWSYSYYANRLRRQYENVSLINYYDIESSKLRLLESVYGIAVLTDCLPQKDGFQCARKFNGSGFIEAEFSELQRLISELPIVEYAMDGWEAREFYRKTAFLQRSDIDRIQQKLYSIPDDVIQDQSIYEKDSLAEGVLNKVCNKSSYSGPSLPD